MRSSVVLHTFPIACCLMLLCTSVDGLGEILTKHQRRSASNGNGLMERISRKRHPRSNIANMGFKTVDGKLKVIQRKTFLHLTIPPVINERTMTDSVLTVIVKGLAICNERKHELPKELRKHINMNKYEEGCIAATYTARDIIPQEMIIGTEKRCAANDETTTSNCILLRGETYVIYVVVINKKGEATASITSSPISITDNGELYKHFSFLDGLLILGICVLIFLFTCRHKISKFVRRIYRLDFCTSNSQTFPMSSTNSMTVLSPAPLGTSSMDDHHPNQNYEDTTTTSNFDDFENYVRESIASGLLRAQFKMLQNGLTKSCEYGLLPENRSKNRYLNVIPYDDTRVVLKKISGKEYSDYINANYVHGYCKKNAYISTQDPKRRTVTDFWRMIWEKEAMVIVMVADVVAKNDQTNAQTKWKQYYWPESISEPKKYGKIVVVTENHRRFADYTLRTFRVSCRETTRIPDFSHVSPSQIEHICFTGWPKHSVPFYTHSVISCLMKLYSMTIGEGPIVVHSNAGVGRTGALILCDICLRKAAATGRINVLAELKKLRESRSNIVENELQYIFVHIVLAECLLSPPTKLPCNSILPQAIELMKEQLPEHMKRLRYNEWKDQVLRSDSAERNNRIPELLLTVTARPIHFEPYPMRNNDINCISVVSVDSIEMKQQYLATQLPLPEILSDFWRLVTKQNVKLIIVLQRADPKDPTCCGIIPPEDPFDTVPFENFTIDKISSSNTGKYFTLDELLVTDYLQDAALEKTRKVNVLTCAKWGFGKYGKPPTPESLIHFWITAKNIRQDNEGPVVVLCYDGVTGCGLYMALSFLLERMSLERECDVILAVRSVRRSNSDFVYSQDQFEYLYDAAAKYMEIFET